MKLNFNKTVAILLVATTALLFGCVDNEKDLFDAEKVKEMYQNSFPVKDIDPNMDWKTTAEANVNIIVNEDLGTDYKVQIFDANPLSAINKAKLLAEGYANQEMAFQTTIDYPKALNTVFVARVDEKGRYLVKPVSIEDGNITAKFGNNQEVISRAATRASTDNVIPTMEAPYTADQIKDLIEKATEIKNGWDLSGGTWVDSNEPVFQIPANQTRYFKITRSFTGNFNSHSNNKVTIIVDTELNADNIGNLNGEVQLVFTKNGSLKLNKKLQLTNSSYISVLQGGRIYGTGELYYSNGSNGNPNYNAGTIDIKTLAVDCAGNFFNYGTMTLNSYQASTSNACLINRGTIKANKIEGNNNTDIKNGCYINVTNNLTCRHLILGNNSSIECGTFKHDGSHGLTLTMGSSSMLYCKGETMLNRLITGPNTGKALIRIGALSKQDGYNECYIKSNIICELPEKEQKSTSDGFKLGTDKWSAFDFLLKYIQNGGNTNCGYCNVGKADFILPEGECTGDGYTPENEGDEIAIDPQTYAYAFEDNYPEAGDYDFNDIILDVKSTCIRNRTNQISKIQYYVTLSAVGATKKLGAGLRLVGIKASEVVAIEFEDANNMRSTLDGSIFENAIKESDKDIVIPLFGDAHKVYGQESNRKMLNTNKNSIIEKPYVLKVIITLADQTKEVPLIANANLDFFIAYSTMNPQAKRTEVHLYEFRKNGATDNGDVHNRNLEVAGKLTWAICVPDFNYPTEKTVITTAYPEFSQWATTGGINNTFKEWYKHPVKTDTDKYIFR